MAWETPSSWFFWNSVRRRSVSSSLNVWWNSPLKPSGSGLLFAGRFFDYCSNFIRCSDYSGFLILPDSVLENCMFLRIYPFCSVYWHIIVHNIFLQSVVFLWYFSCCFFSFIFFLDFIYLSLERGEGRRKERERNTNVWLPLVHPLWRAWLRTKTYALTGNQTSDPLVLRPPLNPLSHSSQGSLLILFIWALSLFFLNESG